MVPAWQEDIPSAPYRNQIKLVPGITRGTAKINPVPRSLRPDSTRTSNKLNLNPHQLHSTAHHSPLATTSIDEYHHATSPLNRSDAIFLHPTRRLNSRRDPASFPNEDAPDMTCNTASALSCGAFKVISHPSSDPRQRCDANPSSPTRTLI